VIKKADAGRKAFRMQAEQPYQGGGNYGKLRYHGVGGGQMYVEYRPVWNPMHLQPVFAKCRVYGGSVSVPPRTDRIPLPSAKAF